MVDPNKHCEVRDLFDKLRAEKNTLQAKSTPLRDERDRLLASIQPTLDKVKALDLKIKDIERPRLAELDNQISGLARILGPNRPR